MSFKLMFVEVRTKSFLYDKVASHLMNEMNISWLIQNHYYRPKHVNNLYFIDYPDKDLIKKYRDNIPQDILEEVSYSDRMIQNYEINSEHYGYYWEKISEIIDNEKPNLIIGELGNFHTHMVQLYANRNSIIFLDPESCRYPNNRFSFYYDREYKAKYGSEDIFSDDKNIQLLNDIRTGVSVPDYMKISKGISYYVRKIIYKVFVVLYSYIRGEKYATQSPFIFIKLFLNKKRLYRQWEDSAVSNLKSISNKNKQDKYLLYPMQMQPEFNLDVWGRRHREQTDLIYDILSNLPDNWKLIIKPNPKSNLEINQELISLLNNKNIIALAHSVPMRPVKKIIDNVITVTGTIAIERIFENKPVIILNKTEHLIKHSVCSYLPKLENLASVLEKNVIDSDDKDACSLLTELIYTSYEGTISEPIEMAYCMHDNNIELLVKAFRDIVSKVKHD